MKTKEMLEEKTVNDICGGVDNKTTFSPYKTQCPECGSNLIRLVATRVEHGITIGTFRCLMCGAKFQDSID